MKEVLSSNLIISTKTGCDGAAMPGGDPVQAGRALGLGPLPGIEPAALVRMLATSGGLSWQYWMEPNPISRPRPQAGILNVNHENPGRPRPCCDFVRPEQGRDRRRSPARASLRPADRY